MDKEKIERKKETNKAKQRSEDYSKKISYSVSPNAKVDLLEIITHSLCRSCIKI